MVRTSSGDHLGVDQTISIISFKNQVHANASALAMKWVCQGVHQIFCFSSMDKWRKR
jgi:hypothetical protein